MTLSSILPQIADAERSCGRRSGSVTVVAVSKLQPLDRVQAALAAGHREFGENYVKEAAEKWPLLRAKYPDTRLHLIGPLQSNKAKAAVGLFDAIHSIDRISLAVALAKSVQASGTCPQLFVQINTGGEPQKAGIASGAADQFIAECQRLDLRVLGLMCIPPSGQEPIPHFQMLADIAARNGLYGLSMGMSGDFKAAISLGATHVRIGSAVFGERSTKEPKE
ncbi:YggS family pyridoxal phosphate-dependent enzyme [Brucella grignonensis]|uniref:YggS family pyridoxal phosphate-dependent enzyme n=1 Tax=Brucella grignonensis TaxID=94627 RepID=UPI000B9924F3|nr:YggS family pyridoxal phosphate-dependent enzyme [Brucella grignonensis]